jgi:hypothetical protein
MIKLWLSELVWDYKFLHFHIKKTLENFQSFLHFLRVFPLLSIIFSSKTKPFPPASPTHQIVQRLKVLDSPLLLLT